MERYRDEDRQQEAGACVMGEMRKDRELETDRKLRQEAEGELSIMKGIETNRVKEAQEALANALEVIESNFHRISFFYNKNFKTNTRKNE